jgi:hypothetical protein
MYNKLKFSEQKRDGMNVCMCIGRMSMVCGSGRWYAEVVVFFELRNEIDWG